MIEGRRSERRRCLIGARIVFNHRGSTMDCTLRNFSEDGALLKFAEAPLLPKHVDIAICNRDALIPAEVRWQSGKLLGVAFPSGNLISELRKIAAFAVSQSAPAGVALH